MKRAPITYRPSVRPKEKFARLRAIERDFHLRAFGAELARVNLELTIEQRLAYLDGMRRLLRQSQARRRSKLRQRWR